jgi:hypothetical protein
VTYSGSAVNPQTGSYTQGTKGTTESARNKCITATVTVVANGRTSTKTTDIYQAANEVTSKKISPQDPVPTQETIPATQAGYSYSGRECDLVYKYSSGSSKVAMSIGEPGASQYGLGVILSLVDSSGNISASGNYVTFGANTTTSERYAIVNMKFVTNQSDWDSDIYQITITQEAKSGPGTLTIKFLGTAPRIAYYVQMLINGIAVTGPTKYSVQSSINGFTISEGELSYVLAINSGSGNILVNLADSNGGSPSYRAELTQPQATRLLNGTSISIFANKLA